MKERPILFSAPMVRSIMDGKKSQTRRAIQFQPPSDEFKLSRLMDTTDSDKRKHIGKLHWVKIDGVNIADETIDYFNCPHGIPGDRLWVKETWQGPLFYDEIPEDWNSEKYKNPKYCHYRASFHSCDFIDADDNYVERWAPSIFMPRWASRILLEITNVRVERLNDISEEDAIAEGCFKFPFEDDHAYTFYENDKSGHATHTGAYRKLWESINGKGSWDINPYVWVIEFKRIT